MFRNLTPLLKRSLDALLTPADDPRRLTSDSAGAPAQPPLDRIRTALTTITHTRERLAHAAAQLDTIHTQVTSHAERARQSGDTDSAAALQTQLHSVESDRRALAAQSATVAAEEQRLRLAERRLVAQLETVRARQEIAAARYSAAAAEVQAGEALAGLLDGLHNLHADLEAAESEAEAMQARAAAVRSLIT